MQLSRIAKLRTVLQENGLEALLVTNAFNRFYLTGFSGSAGYVLITGSKAYLLVDFRYTTQAAEQAAQFEIVEHAVKPMDTVKELLSGLGIRRIGFEQQDVTYGGYISYREQLGSIELVATDSLVENLRMVKDEQEIAVMQEAADLADRTFSHILGFIKPGVSERELAVELEMFMRRHGATSTSFETIVASGERSALPHGKASDRVLKWNEFVKFDFGALYKGYCSDITRTVVLGQPTEQHKKIYDIVREAQSYALEHIKPGMTGIEADALARGVIAKYGYADHFGHGLGHGLGLEIHEAPRLSKTGETVLAPGMMVTVEPGIYIPGFGGVRIEDDVVITEQGLRILTHSSKDLIVIN
ncbi:M24 family metallopeptidase [Paenibacillus hamazuiensis]|uniref:M24 family metallopeptidase n=1 Tax=Paenibacillus hamazuiensis TaxID=2936508 RepID=UPI00200CAEAC|nr:Xaa-Pro peptidase family protein [Paenibacillus hamazuiensis]